MVDLVLRSLFPTTRKTRHYFHGDQIVSDFLILSRGGALTSGSTANTTPEGPTCISASVSTATTSTSASSSSFCGVSLGTDKVNVDILSLCVICYLHLRHIYSDYSFILLYYSTHCHVLDILVSIPFFVLCYCSLFFVFRC